MDPLANLKEQRQIAEALLKLQDQCDEAGAFTPADQVRICHAAMRLAELVQSLDTWLSAGGFFPQPWARGRR